MNPRRSDSKKWTQLPKELSEHIRSAVEEGFKNELKNNEILIDGKIYQNEVTCSIGFTTKGQLKQPNFQISFDIGDSKDDVWPTLQIGLDFIQGTMLDYFNDEENSELPLAWKKVNFKNHIFYFQYSTANTELESMANQLLGETHDEALVESTLETEDAFEMTDIEDEESLEALKGKNHLH